jgi:RND family efflux transporter MFP subunit
MKSSMPYNLRMILLFCLCCFAVVGCRKQEEEPPEASELVPVITQTIFKQPVTRPVLAKGVVHPLQEETLSFQTGGRVEKIFSPVGARVAEGDTLASLNYSQLIREWVNRGLQLIAERKRLPQLQEALQKGEISRAQYESEREKVSLMVDIYYNAKAALERAALISPMNGNVIGWRVAEGDSVQAGQPAVVIADYSPLAIAEATLSEKDYHQLQIGDSAVVTPVEEPVLPFNGTVREKHLSDESTPPFVAVIAFENPGAAIPLGAEATVRIRGHWTENAVLIPKEALLEYDGVNATVFLTDSRGKFAVRRHVLAGPEIDDRVLIEKGLHDGDRLIVHGQDQLKQGSRILILQ